MKKLSLALFVSSAILSQSAFSAETNRTLSYLTSWGQFDDAVAQLEKSKVDTFLLSFGGWDKDGNIFSSDKIIDKPEYNAWYQIPTYIAWTQTKLTHPEKKMMVAFGGETYESMWSHLDNAESREKIAQGLVKLLKTGFPVYKKNLKPQEMEGECLSYSWDGKTCDMSHYQRAGTVYLDGIDFDYEKVARLTPAENDNLLELAQRVRQLLGPKSNKLLSLTTYHVGADPESCMDPSVTKDCSFVEDKRSSHHGEVLPLLKKGKDTFDFFNVMTYDAGKNFKYDVAMANYARAVGDASKILLGNTINSQWGPDGRYVEDREKNIERAAWQAKNNYGGFFVWTLGHTTQQLSFSDQVEYINAMHHAAENANGEIINKKPSAVVKYPQEVIGAANVILNGADSVDPEGAPLTFKWEQISGPHVTLLGTNQSQVSFTLNSTDKDVDLGFRLTVNDGELDSAPFDFTIKHKTETPETPDNGVHASWQAAKVYVGGDVVSWQGKEYKARWWTQGDRPGSSDVWENLNKADQQEWNVDTVYHGGDTAIWQGKNWKAKWWTKGEQPGTSSVWEMVK